MEPTFQERLSAVWQALYDAGVEHVNIRYEGSGGNSLFTPEQCTDGKGKPVELTREVRDLVLHAAMEAVNVYHAGWFYDSRRRCEGSVEFTFSTYGVNVTHTVFSTTYATYGNKLTIPPLDLIQLAHAAGRILKEET